MAPRKKNFWEYVDFQINGCWNWTGNTFQGGYGFHSYTQKYAHRRSYEMCVGPLPADRWMVVDHLCRNRRCVNPSHLELVTQTENLRRGWVSRGGQRSNA